jgi:hypothetical protein
MFATFERSAANVGLRTAVRPRSAAAIATLCALAGVASLALGCGSGPEHVAFENKVFYQYDTLNPAQAAKSLEAHYPPLDKTESPPLPEYVGVGVLGDVVHLSRPRDWVIRAGSLQPEHRYIEYVSPNEYMVAVYELVESPDEPWREVLGRYEDQAKKAGAELLGQRVPMASENAQGRAYLVRRPVAAAKGPLVNYANEYLLRSDHRIVLLQIVHHGENLAPIDGELRRVVETIRVD